MRPCSTCAAAGFFDICSHGNSAPAASANCVNSAGEFNNDSRRSPCGPSASLSSPRNRAHATTPVARTRLMSASASRFGLVTSAASAASNRAIQPRQPVNRLQSTSMWAIALDDSAACDTWSSSRSASVHAASSLSSTSSGSPETIVRAICRQDEGCVCDAMESAIQSIKENATQCGEVIGGNGGGPGWPQRRTGLLSLTCVTVLSLNRPSRVVIHL